jgi:general secretion pathway protein H
MRTSATGTTDGALMGKRGHSLLEILVVIVILGVLSGLVMLTMGRNRQSDLLVEDSRRLATLIRAQCEDALLAGRSSGVQVDNSGFRFMVIKDSAWQPHPDAAFRPRSWSVPLQIRLDADGVGTRDPRRDMEGDAPQILCLLTGELTPFELELVIPGATSERLRGTADGRVERSLP